MTTSVTAREALLVVAGFILLVALIYFWRSYGAPPEGAVPEPTATLAITILPTVAPSPTWVEAGPPTTRTPVPERLLTTPTRVPPLVLPPTETPTPTAEPTVTPVRTMQQKG